MMRRIVPALGALLLVVLVAAPAVADHVFSHRVYVAGRVVDAEGRPAPGLPVTLSFEGLNASARCFDAKEERTGPMGDFELCRHVHALPQEARVNVTVGEVSRTVGLDADLRSAVAHLQLPGAAPARDLTGDRAFARTFVVAGRQFALLPKPAAVEGILVNATPVYDNVTVMLRGPAGELANATARPDEMGRFHVELAVSEVPAGALVVATAGPVRAEESASALFRRVDVALVHDLRLAAGPGDEAPGSDVPAPAGLAAVALGAAAWAVMRRR